MSFAAMAKPNSVFHVRALSSDFGAFGEYKLVGARCLRRVPRVNRRWLPPARPGKGRDRAPHRRQTD